MPYPAYDLKAERIKLVNNVVKVTWKMDPSFNGEIVIGRSEKEITKTEDVLKSLLIGTFTPSQEGIIIDRNVQQGKKYYYLAITKDDLLKREIKILNNVNCTVIPVSFFPEPGPVESIESEIFKETSVKVSWDKARGSRLVYNVYRSKSMIASRADIEVAEKITSTDDDSFIDSNIPEYGTYFYAVTITDKNSIEYFTPSLNKNYTSRGIYIKGRTLTTPLNTGAFAGQDNSIIVKWEKGNSLTGKEISGYEIYRSDEIIDSLLKLKFAKLIYIADNSTTLYKDLKPGQGKYYYAVFARYNDGSVDINFDTDSNYTKLPVLITVPYSVTAMDAELSGDNVVIKWNYTGNSGNETVTLFRTKSIIENSGQLMPDYIIGTENIKTGIFRLTAPAEGKYYYGVYIKDETGILDINPGINITPVPLGIEMQSDTAEDKNTETKKGSTFNNSNNNQEKRDETDKSYHEIDYIIKKYFYGEQYRTAIKELNLFISKTDNVYDRAKARLYLARTYIELEEYGKAVKILSLPDVKEYFPEDTRFWSDFALARIK